MLRAQDSTITIKDPAEFNTYQMATTQSDPGAKASALEGFLTAYPQSVVKKAVLDMLLDIYYTPKPRGLGDSTKALKAATGLLQVDPNNLKAILYSVIIKKGICGKAVDPKTGQSTDPATCDDAAALSRKGLVVPKPADVSDADWKAQTGGSYPVFHSAIAFDDAIAHKDYKGAIAEYTAELMLYTDDQAKTMGLQDTYLLAMAYAQPDPSDTGKENLVKAIWFYARVWNFVPAGAKAGIEKSLEYYYTKYHGNLKGLDDIKSQAALTTFPPGTLTIAKAPTPAEIAHDALLQTTNLSSMNLGDAEFVLANGSQEDVDKLWNALKDRVTPVPGDVIEANASAIKVVVTQGIKLTDFNVKLTTPVACKDFSAPAADLKQQQDFILASGVKDDTEKLSALFNDPKVPIKKITIEPTVSVVKVAVTDDAKAAKTADFIVNLKTPAPCKEVPAAGSAFGIQSKGEAELDGTYDTHTLVPATDTALQSALIVLRDGAIVPKKAVGPVHAKPSPAHHTAH
jgi:hypothetical protein